MKKIFLLFCFMCFANFSLSQEDSDIYGLFDEPEDIACEDLSEAFKKYDEDRSLNQIAMESSLTQTIQTLREVSNEDAKSKEKLSQLIDNLSEAVRLSQDNTLIFLDKADNISYFLQDCTTQETSDSKTE